jgi:hypothetical protein
MDHSSIARRAYSYQMLRQNFCSNTLISFGGSSGKNSFPRGTMISRRRRIDNRKG